mgnify:CR=1 FL=1
MKFRIKELKPFIPPIKLLELAVDELNKRDISELRNEIKREKLNKNTYLIHLGKIAELRVFIYAVFIFLHDFYVGSPAESNLQNRGIGTLLLENVKEFAKRIRKPIILDCRIKNKGFYENNGFKEKGRNITSNKENIITMEYKPKI